MAGGDLEQQIQKFRSQGTEDVLGSAVQDVGLNTMPCQQEHLAWTEYISNCGHSRLAALGIKRIEDPPL